MFRLDGIRNIFDFVLIVCSQTEFNESTPLRDESGFDDGTERDDESVSGSNRSISEDVVSI